MNNFADWSPRVERVQDLKFDPHNPRLPAGGRTDVRDIIAELVQEERVVELAEDIAEQGYFPTEIMVAIRTEEGDAIILEGNRRLAALKLLLAPDLAPADQLKRVQLLHRRVDPKQIAEVPVTFAPSREAAAPLIVKRHMQTGVKGWVPVQQARYLRTLATPDMPLESLAKLVGLERGAVASVLRQHALYELACKADLPAPILAKVRDPRQFNASTFERLTSSSDIQKLLGLSFDELARPQTTLKQAEFDKTFGRMITDVALEKVNTRTLNNAESIRDYIAKLGDDAPDPTPVAPHDPGPKPPPPPASPPVGPVKKKAARTPVPTASLVPRGLRSRLRHPRINAVFEELRHLKVASFPNASAVMLRIVLEMLVSNYLDVTKKIQPLLDALKKRGKGDDFYPSLRQMLDLLLNQDKEFSGAIPPQQLRRLRKMIAQDDHPLSLDELDQFVHNRHAAPTEAQLRTFWGQLEPLIDTLLDEPAKPTPAKPTKPAGGKP